MIATLAILIIEAVALGGSDVDLTTFAAPRPGLERLSGQAASSINPRLEPAAYPLDLSARGTVVFLLPKGPRTLRSLEIVPTVSTRDAWRSARIRLVWDADDPEQAGLDLPIDLTFGGLAESETAWINRLPMPYRDGAMLVIDTETAISGRIRIESSAEVEQDAGFLRGRVFAEKTTIEESGRGRLAAVVSKQPGSIALVVDGMERKQIEPLFTIGGKVSARGNVSWFADPIPFQRSFRLEGKAGTGSRSALFWYSDRPSSGRSPREKQP